MKRIALIGGLAVLVLLGVLLWAFGLPGSRAVAEAPADLVSPEQRSIVANVLATGIVRLRVGAEVRVGSQVSGIVEQLNVTVGSRIERGEVIAVIDRRVLEARLAQARAQVAVVEQELRRTEVELARIRRLSEQRLIAPSEVEDAALAVDETRAKREKARRDAVVVETDLGYTVLRAPISGTVASVSTQKGETVAASFAAPTFVTIIGDHALQLVAMVDETDIGAVSAGNPVTFTVEAFPAVELTGRVESIAPKGTLVSGVVNYEVMIEILSPAEALKPDMTANVSIRTAERQALVLPDAAVQREGAERFVWVDAGGALERRAVTLGSREAGYTEVRRGLAPDDRVLRGKPAGGQVKGEDDAS